MDKKREKLRRDYNYDIFDCPKCGEKTEAIVGPEACSKCHGTLCFSCCQKELEQVPSDTKG